MMTGSDLGKYLPQCPPMRLIDTILAVDSKLARCKTTITTDNIFYDPNISGIYSWVGVELMAQTMAVLAHFPQPDTEPQIGYLISIRNFSCKQLFFQLGDTVIITAENEYLQDGIGVFACQIELNGCVVASAKLTAVEPK